MPEGMPDRMQQELLRLETGTTTFVIHKLGPSAGFTGLFCPYCAYLARMKTRALLPDGASGAVPCQRGVHHK